MDGCVKAVTNSLLVRCTFDNCVLLCVGKELVDYITEYLTKIRDRQVIPDVKPGYMRELLPENPPLDGENWDSIFQDVEKIIMPGVRSHGIRQI